MVRPQKDNAYETFLKNMNKIETRVICECGKRVVESKLEKHLQTRYHETLMDLKKRNCTK
jgi:hypothetical protein